MNNFAKAERISEKKKQPLKIRVIKTWMAVLLCISLVTMTGSLIFYQFEPLDRDDIVIVLDPGHGGVDVGAQNSKLGLYESEINLKIALACRDRLEKYDGVKIYMTHTGVRSLIGDSSLRNRVDVAEEVGADIFISLHTNSANSKSAKGSEIYVPHTTYKTKYNEDCTELAEIILNKFKSLGLNSRGVKTRKSGGARTYTHSDGTQEIGDYYYVVGEPIRRLGIPGILVEHAFIDGDSEFLDSDEDLVTLGTADADAIAEYYGLKLKPEYKNNSEEVSSVSNAVSSHDVSSADNGRFTSDKDKDEEVTSVEEMIKALPANPIASDEKAVKETRAAFDALGKNKQNMISVELYQKLCSAITAYENNICTVRIAVKSGSQMSIDRINNKLLNVEAAMQASGKVTVFSLMLELELYIDPSAPDEYKDEANIDYRILTPDGTRLAYDDTVPNGSILTVNYGDKVLDSLTLSMT